MLTYRFHYIASLFSFFKKEKEKIENKTKEEKEGSREGNRDKKKGGKSKKQNK